MTVSRIRSAAVAVITAASLVAGAGVAAANEGGTVTVHREGSSGFDFNSSGTGKDGEPSNAAFNSSRSGFTSSAGKGDTAKANANAEVGSSGLNKTLEAVLIIAGIATIVHFGYQFGLANGTIRR